MNSNVVIIPTYNEIENIEDIIRYVFAHTSHFDILVVDDTSPDGTAEQVKKMQSEFKDSLFLEVRKEKNGLGKAYIHGFKWALQKKYKTIFEMDADFSHNPKDLTKMLESLNSGKDVVIGSRYYQGVRVINWPINRILLSFGASIYVRLITQMPVKDPTAGFVGYTANVLQKLDLDGVKFKGYGFQIEMKYKAWKKGFKLQEVPIIFTDREKGESKISSDIIWESIFGVVSLKIKSIFKTL